jgi:hypothetical protein
MKRTIFLIVILAIIFYFQFPYINTINNEYDIIQYDNPNKSIFESMSSEKKIAIFTNIPIDLSYENIKYSSFTEEFTETLKKNNQPILKKQIANAYDYYKIPLCLKSNININYLTKNTKTPLVIQTNYRFLLTEIKNTCKLYLFAPYEYNNLYFNKNNTNVNFWNQDLEKYPKLNDAKYIEILLHKNQMINIPYKWIYCVETMEEDCLNITLSNESIFSFILKR